MDLDATKKFLLVKAIEESDPQGSVIPLDERAYFGYEGADEELLAVRAEKLFEKLAGVHPLQTGAAMAVTGSHAWVKFAVVAVAFLIGLATKQLGPERKINVLAFPLLGVLGWNVLVYLFSLLGCVFRKRSGPGLAALGGVIKLAAERGRRRLNSGGDQILANGLSRFVGVWYAITAELRVARARGSLHLGAAALSIGVIAGMYWNGLAYQYLAAWESTFLSPEGVHGLFSVLFAPASALSGIAVPGIEEIRLMELKAGGSGSQAAGWIHLFAITVGWCVLLPRLLMAWLALRKATRLEQGIDFREAAPEYVARLLKTREGGNLVARVVAHRMELGSKERDRLRAFVHQLWGGQLWVEFSDPIAYGDEDEAEIGSGDYQVLVMNFSTTPEDESQGRLVKRFRGQLTGSGLVLLAAAPFSERFGGLGELEFERRFAERREAWGAVLGRAGVGFAVYDGDAQAARAEAADAVLKPRVN